LTTRKRDKEINTKIKRYLNPVASMHLINNAIYNVLIAARGFSKSFTNGLKQARKVELMPRSLGLFTSPTYSMIYSKTLIPMKAAWDQHMGYVEGIHYVVGKAPPNILKNHTTGRTAMKMWFRSGMAEPSFLEALTVQH